MEKVRDKLYKVDPYVNVVDIGVEVQGWGSNSHVFKDVISQYHPRLIIEVGTWKGASAINMANICKELYQGNNFEIVCIDTFLGSFEHWGSPNMHMEIGQNGRPILYEKFLCNVCHHNHQDVITPFPIDSYNGWKVLQNLNVLADMVYIDAGHDHDQVLQDLLGFCKVLKKGGVLLGDDIHHGPVEEVCHKVLNNWQRMSDKYFFIN